MATPSDKLSRLRGMLGKVADTATVGGISIIGSAGEFLAERLLDELKLAWIKTVQDQNVYSAVLRDTVKASRPDYIVKLDDDNIFIDAKNLSRTTDNGGTIGFSIGCCERDRLIEAEKYFGLSVIILVWDRSDSDFTYAFSVPSEFTSSKIVMNRPCYEALFETGAFHQLKL